MEDRPQHALSDAGRAGAVSSTSPLTPGSPMASLIMSPLTPGGRASLQHIVSNLGRTGTCPFRRREGRGQSPACSLTPQNHQHVPSDAAKPENIPRHVSTKAGMVGNLRQHVTLTPLGGGGGRAGETVSSLTPTEPEIVYILRIFRNSCLNIYDTLSFEYPEN